MQSFLKSIIMPLILEQIQLKCCMVQEKHMMLY